MSLRVRVLCRPEPAAGYRLAGLEPRVAADAEEAAAALTALRADPSVGLVLIQDALFRTLPPRLARAGGEAALPLLVPVPDPGAAEDLSAAEERILEIVRRAVGYRVRIR